MAARTRRQQIQHELVHCLRTTMAAQTFHNCLIQQIRKHVGPNQILEYRYQDFVDELKFVEQQLRVKLKNIPKDVK